MLQFANVVDAEVEDGGRECGVGAAALENVYKVLGVPGTSGGDDRDLHCAGDGQRERT